MFMILKDVSRSAELIMVEEMAECSGTDVRRVRRKGQVRLNSHKLCYFSSFFSP